MNFEERINFLLDIRITSKKYKNQTIVFCFGKPVEEFIKFLDFYIKIPYKQVNKKDWYTIGYILAQYFDKKIIKMVYGNNKKCEKNEKPPRRSKETNSFYR